MLKLIALSLVAFAMAQVFRPGNLVIDRVGEFRVEYDDQHNIILLVSDTECFIVEAPDASWDPLVRDREDLHNATLAIVRQIDTNRGLTEITQRAATQAYESILEQLQCFRKNIYKISYTPTSA